MDLTSLPPEIRVMILKHLASGNNISQYATVCLEWQTAIEQLNFRSLSLTAQDVPTLNNIMAKRNLSLIKYIWYSIELQSYDCSDCNHHEYEEEHEAAAVAIKDGIRTMLQALSKRSHSRDMTLDLSIYSPSDAEHYFKYIRFEPSNALSRNRIRGQASHHVPVHSTMRSLDAVLRIFTLFILTDLDASGHETSESGEEFWASIPQVSCVTRLLLRRQTRRRWDPIAISRLLAHFPNLEDLVIEPWSAGVNEIEMDTDKRKCSYTFNTIPISCGTNYSLLSIGWTDLVFPSLIPNNLKRMTIFEDFSEAYDPANRLYVPREIVHPAFGTIIIPPSGRQYTRAIRIVSAQLTRALAEASLGLQHLSVAFMTDARLFWSVRRDWVWEHLQTLALTSEDFEPHNDPRKIEHVLYSAARAVKKMPKLQTMELWNGGKGNAALFRYSIDRGRQAKIVWRANWHFELKGLVVKEWQDVAYANDVGHLKIENELLTPSQIRSHGEAILILELEIEVACPVSIQQIHREHVEMERQ